MSRRHMKKIKPLIFLVGFFFLLVFLSVRKVAAQSCKQPHAAETMSPLITCLATLNIHATCLEMKWQRRGEGAAREGEEEEEEEEESFCSLADMIRVPLTLLGVVNRMVLGISQS